MGVVYSTLIRKVQRFNVENRAFRQIEKKPVAAPRHPSSEQFYEDVVKATPEIKFDLTRKDSELDNYLKDVYVTSTGTTLQIKRDKSQLPQNRSPVEDDELGFWEPLEAPEGYCNLKQILQMLADHQTDPKLWSAETLARKYKLKQEKVALILDYYKPFNVYLPTKKTDSQGQYSTQKILEKVNVMLPGQNSQSNEKSSSEQDKKDKT